MGWGAQQWLRATKESVYGQYNSGAPSGDIWWPRLHASNAFTMRPDVSKTRKVIRTADAGNRMAQVVNARTVYGGKLVTPLYPSQCAWLLGWALTLTSNDLPSYTLDFWDGVRSRRYLGVKVDGLSITADDSSDFFVATLNLTGQTTDTNDPVLAQPAASVYPTEVPWKFTETRGLITASGTPITKYKSFAFSVANKLRGKFNEWPYISSLYYCGRDVGYHLNPEYLVSDWRGYFEAQTPLTIAAALNRSAPSHSLNLNFQTASYLAELPPEDLPLEDAAYTELGFESFFDPTSSTDLTFSAA